MLVAYGRRVGDALHWRMIKLHLITSLLGNCLPEQLRLVASTHQSLQRVTGGVTRAVY